MSAQPSSTEPSPAQAERDNAARRELARGAGVALLRLSSGLEEGTVVLQGAGAMTMTLVGFAGRARRLLRATYLLLDAGAAAEAVPLLRVMSEYVIVCRWLAKDPVTRLRMWAHDDVRTSLLIDDRVFEHGQFRLMGPETRQFFEEARNALKADPASASKRLPPLEQMAADVDLSFAYNSAYRLDSQAGVHASGMSINNMYEEVAGGWLLKDAPHLLIDVPELYGLAAGALLDLLSDADNAIPELGWTRHLATVQAALQALSAAVRAGGADPGADPAGETAPNAGGS